MITCTCCGIDLTNYRKQTWWLTGYYGVSGKFCSECYEKVSHDSYGKPKNPKQYDAVLERLKV